MTDTTTWESTFPGVHHLKGIDSRLKVSIQELDSGGCHVLMTEAGTFTGMRVSKCAETLAGGKAEGERLSREGFVGE